MADQTGNIGLVIHAKVAYVGENTILPSGTFRDQEHNREYGFWRGSRMKPLRNNTKPYRNHMKPHRDQIKPHEATREPHDTI